MTAFFAIALGSTAYAGWMAHRKGVDVRAPRTTGLGFGIAMRFLAAWSRRRELHSHEAPDDDAAGAADCGIIDPGSPDIP